MERFFDRIDSIRERCDVLRHPFYQRWTRGELSRTELAQYAGQYRHAVVALADATEHAGDTQHAEEERSHISLWDRFVLSVGGDTGAVPSPHTAACVAAWADDRRDRPATLAALYAIESSQPAISQAKRAGLTRHYGAEPNSDSTRYFDLHASLDHAHAAHDRRRLSGLVQPANETRLLAEAERVLRANWQLLDGVDAHPPLA
jgi:pyrroloquinoline-quinone synthase